MRITLTPTAPFRLDLTALALRRDAANVVDRWRPPTYRRVFAPDGAAFEVVVQQHAPTEEPRLTVDVLGPEGVYPTQQVAALLSAVLGLDLDLGAFYAAAANDDPLAELARRFAGLRPPLLPTVFEALVSGVACQQLSLAVGMRLLARLAAAYGAEHEGHHAFPRPEDLSSAEPQHLRAMGFSLRKSETILHLAGAATEGRLDLESLRGVDTGTAVANLMDLPGIGRWTAHYVALRGLGRLEVFPVDDVGAQNKLQDVLGLEQRPGSEETRRIVDRWGAYQGFLYFHLLLDGLERRGMFDPVEPSI